MSQSDQRTSGQKNPDSWDPSSCSWHSRSSFQRTSFPLSFSSKHCFQIHCTLHSCGGSELDRNSLSPSERQPLRGQVTQTHLFSSTVSPLYTIHAEDDITVLTKCSPTPNLCHSFYAVQCKQQQDEAWGEYVKRRLQFLMLSCLCNMTFLHLTLDVMAWYNTEVYWTIRKIKSCGKRAVFSFINKLQVHVEVCTHLEKMGYLGLDTPKYSSILCCNYFKLKDSERCLMIGQMEEETV